MVCRVYLAAWVISSSSRFKLVLPGNSPPDRRDALLLGLEGQVARPFERDYRGLVGAAPLGAAGTVGAAPLG